MAGHPAGGRGSVHDYYSSFGAEAAGAVAATVRGGAEQVKEAVQAFGDIGADELIFNPTIDDLDQVTRLAETVL